MTVLDDAAPPVSGLELQGIAPEVELIEADVRDAERVGATVDAGEFDVVFHLAAQTLVGPAMAEPARTFEVNVGGTWILLEACRRADVPAVIVASSDKAYGPSDQLPYREEMPLRPASPYEASKAAADAIALSYSPAFGLPVAVTRFANVYGGGDLNFSRLVPEAIAAVLDGRRPQIRSDGSPERDFLYVEDAVAAYLEVEHAVGAGGPGAGEAFNAGGERPHSVAEVLKTVAAISGGDLEPEFHGTGNPAGEIDRQFVDSAKLRELTGWQPAGGLARRPDPYPGVVSRASGGETLMCGRFTVTTKDTKKIADRFQVELEKALERGGGGEAPPPSKERAKKAARGMGRFNVAPSQEILVVRGSPDPEEAAAGEREARLMRWGLVPRWAKDLKVGYKMINAKAENLTSSRAYGRWSASSATAA